MLAPVVCFHTELDRYSGAHGFASSGLPNLVRELALTALLHDHVIVAPAVMTAHPLTLPAFESLAPLSRAGILGTSADPTVRSPLKFLSARIDKRLCKLYERTGSVVGRHDLRLGKELQARWSEVLPHAWPVRRPVDAQVQSFRSLIRDRLRALSSNNLAACIVSTRAAVLEAEGRPMTRESLIALALDTRARAGQALVNEVLNTIQATTLELGARFSTQVGEARAASFVYAGAWFGRLHAVGSPSRLLLPTDPRRSAHAARAAFRTIEVDLDRLAALAPLDLLALVTLPEWRPLREAVLSGSRDTESARRLWKQLRNEIRYPRSTAPAAPRTPPVFLFRPGTYRIIAALGMPFVGAAGNAGDPWLDTQRRELHDREETLLLSERQASILSLLAMTQEQGLARSERHALEHELTSREEVPVVKTVAAIESRRRRARAVEGRLRVAFHRLRALLEPTRLLLSSSDGKWRVEVRGGGVLQLRGLDWCGPEGKQTTTPEPDVRRGLRVVWRALWELGPGAVDLDSLCARLEVLRGTARDRSRVARDVHDLAVALRSIRAPWTVLQHHGRYRVLELAGRLENM